MEKPVKIAHILRKYDPTQWGGTETALFRLILSLKEQGIESVVFAPRAKTLPKQDPIRDLGVPFIHYHAFLPVLGLKPLQRDRLLSVGGSIFSLDLPFKLLMEKDLSLIHLHTGSRVGANSQQIAKLKNIPCIYTLHGGNPTKGSPQMEQLIQPLSGGWEWGKLIGWLTGARKLLANVNALITLNKEEASSLKQEYPRQNIFVQPHGIPINLYQQNHTDQVFKTFPYLKSRQILLMLGRIDPQKNQEWAVQQMPSILKKHPNCHLLFTGPITDQDYAQKIQETIKDLGIETHVSFIKALPPDSPLLIGLLQSAAVLLVPSINEPFGLVVLEAFAAKTPVLSSKTLGPVDLLNGGEFGWLFDLKNLTEFQQALDEILQGGETRERKIALAFENVQQKYGLKFMGEKMKALYLQLLAGKKKR